MKNLNRKLKKGHTLQRVNTIREQLAQQRATKARVEVTQSSQAEEERRNDLQIFDERLQDAAGDGLSMQSFMRMQGLREMHVAALGRATTARESAQDFAVQEQQALHVAVAKRRTADHLVSVISSKRALARRSIEQKQSDDLTCTRHGHVSMYKAA